MTVKALALGFQVGLLHIKEMQVILIQDITEESVREAEISDSS